MKWKVGVPGVKRNEQMIALTRQEGHSLRTHSGATVLHVKRRELIEGAVFFVGLGGMFALLIAVGADISTQVNAPWWSRVLPIVVLAYFWPVCLPGSEIRRRTEWPWLFRWPIETAGAILFMALAYLRGRGWVDARFWGILGGVAAALAVAVRGRIETDARGKAADMSP